METLKDLTLPKLRKILRVHYREKSASELYQHLDTIFQQPRTAQQFLLRALDWRNEVGFASKESECEVQYDEPLIQKAFVKSFETGLRDDILAANLRAILRTSGLTRDVSQSDRRQVKPTRYREGCQASKEQRIGVNCQHCFACGEFGHIASECAKSAKRQGNEKRLPRGRDRV